MRSCYQKPNLAKRDFFSLGIPKILLTPLVNPYRKKQSFLFVSYLFSVMFLFAQQKITGVVTGVNDAPLSGATITIKNSKIVAATNGEGIFVVNAKHDDILIISFVGYTPEQVTVGNKTSLKISLALSVNELDQVIVTGYTSQKIKEITGSVAVVKSKDLTNVPAGQVEQMLQGKAAGLTVITSGEPGAAARFIFMALVILEILSRLYY